MSNKLRRFEILLPLQFNDGQAVPDELIADTIMELEKRFGAVSSEAQAIQGVWRSEGVLYRDQLTRVFVDVEDTPASFEFKDRLKERFHQLDIWVTTHPIESV